MAWIGTLGRWLVVGAVLTLSACAGDDAGPPSTTFIGGRVLLAGPDVVLRGATIEADQLEYLAPPPTVVIREHVTDVTTDADGTFFIDGRELGGQCRLTIRGGEYNPVLFKEGTCIEDVDRAGPMIVFELPDAAVTDVRGTIMVRARAMDLLDNLPSLTLPRNQLLHNYRDTTDFSNAIRPNRYAIAARRVPPCGLPRSAALGTLQ